MKTTHRGNQAETAAAEELARQGYKILQRNWRTPVCEIDIVAEKSRVIYFAEVKYRTSQSQGDGLAYITPAKLRRVEYAARVWCQHHGYNGDYRLLAVSVASDAVHYFVEDLIELQ